MTRSGSTSAVVPVMAAATWPVSSATTWPPSRSPRAAAANTSATSNPSARLVPGPSGPPPS